MQAYKINERKVHHDFEADITQTNDNLHLVVEWDVDLDRFDGFIKWRISQTDSKLWVFLSDSFKEPSHLFVMGRPHW